MNLFPYNTKDQASRAYMSQSALWSRPVTSIIMKYATNSSAINSSQIQMSLDPTSANYGDNATSHLYHFTVESGFSFFLNRVNILIRDSKMDPSDFGGESVLSNGCKFDITDTDGITSLLDITDGSFIKSNVDWGLMAGVDFIIAKASGAREDESLSIRWTAHKVGAMFEMATGQRVQITIQDSLGGLVDFRAQVQGFYLEL